MLGADDGLIAWLGAAADPAALGGKGASLDRLVRLGFPVPPGFCLTLEAFRAQRSQVLAAIAPRSPVDDTGVPHWAAGLASAPLAEVVAGPLRSALDRLVDELASRGLGAPRFAVRSSALGEDGADASYAGLHETELDLGAEEVPGAVVRCWASLWSPAALAYRQRRGIAADAAEMAVVVQALVPADAAAVVFTRHPVTGRDDQVVITAVRGLGDAMVAGTVTPDTYVVDKASRVTLELDRGEDPLGPSLDPARLDGLVKMALAVESRFGAAVDIEAAFGAGAWYLLQARPITTGPAMISGRPA